MAAARNSKEVASRLHEKHQTILADLLREEENRYCADCLAKGERGVGREYGACLGLDYRVCVVLDLILQTVCQEGCHTVTSVNS